MTDAPKKRPWFQYHLSTLIVIQFVAAGLIWLNVQGRVYTMSYGNGVRKVFNYRGWPLTFSYVSLKGTPDSPIFSFANCTIDAGVGLAVILFIALVCEWSIRRAERKP